MRICICLQPALRFHLLQALWLNGAPAWVATEMERLEGRAPQLDDNETPPF